MSLTSKQKPSLPWLRFFLAGMACSSTPSVANWVPDVAKLPPPANSKIDFDRDIRPIFEKTCFRCHGPEKPKSRFRLDNRDSALRGGENNADDIVPGDSGRSRLIHYVTQLVPDMEMPPAGKGEPLRAEQISLLRAWIDQGANWSSTNTFPQLAYSISPTIRWIGVDGDRKKFREIEGVPEGWGGGAEEFSMQENLSPDEKLTSEGHVLFPDHDVRVTLALEKSEIGFIRGGFEEWRRYYDDSGGFYRPFSPPQFDLNSDLYLDTGRAWADFGLTRPDWPQIVFGYEYQFKDGTKSMLELGGVYDQNFVGKNIYPATKEIHEHTHILKLDITHELYGWRVADNARVEFYTDRTFDQQIVSYTSGPNPDALTHTHENYGHVQGANVLRAEKQITDWWFASGGYLYSRLEGDSSLHQTTVDANNNPTFGNYWHDQVTLRRETHAFSVASMFLPVEGLSLSLAAQNEWTRQEGFGDIGLDSGDPNAPGLFLLQPAMVRSDLDETKTAENIELRYIKIPYTVLFAQGRFAQDSIGQFEQETGDSPDVFLRNTDYFNLLEDFRAGFNTSPWRWAELSAHYRRRDSNSDYNNLQDENNYTPSGEGYSAFIRHREILTDEVVGKLVLRPASWLKTTLTYHWTKSDFFTATDPVNDPFYGNVSPGGGLQTGYYAMHTYGINTVFMPSPRLYFTGTFTYGDSRTLTWAQKAAPTVVVPYRGETFSVMASANYTLNAKTDLQFAYDFSHSDYAQNNSADGLPLGLDYTRHGLTAGVTRKLTRYLTSNLRYSFYRYSEPTSGGFNDFTAHGIFATVVIKWK